MSRNNKNARLHKDAKAITALHLKGEKGPEKTKPQHGKKKAWWQVPPYTYAAFAKGGKAPKGAATEAA